MAKNIYALFQGVATKLKSLASKNDQSINKKVNKYLQFSSLENRVPIKQKQVNLTLKCLRYILSLKTSSSLIVTNKQTNNEMECQILVDQQNCIFHPQLILSSLLSSEKGQGEKERGKAKNDKIKETGAQCCGYQDKLRLDFSCAGFPCTSGILTDTSAPVHRVPICVSGHKCSPLKFLLHNKSAATFLQIFTKTRLSFDPGGICASTLDPSVVKRNCAPTLDPSVVKMKQLNMDKMCGENLTACGQSGFKKQPKMKISPKICKSTIFSQNDLISLKFKIFDVLKITWKKDGKEIFNKYGRVSIIKRPCFTILKIKRAKTKDTGAYTLDIENMCGQESITLLVQVHVKKLTTE